MVFALALLGLGGLVGFGGLVALAVLFPLATYAVTLALFGLAHVAFEARYVDGRFGTRARISRPFLWAVIGLTGAVVSVRALFVAHALPPAWDAPLEVGILALLAAVAAPLVAKEAPVVAASAVALAVLLGACVLLAPVPALTVFALVHNVTPIGFLAEAAPRHQRRRVALGGALLFLGVPALVASGAVHSVFHSLGAPLSEAAPFSMGPLAQHLRVYVPAGLGGPAAVQLFSAAVVAQVLHYVATIVVFPWLARRNGDDGHLVRWPTPRAFALGVGAASAVLLLGFFASFRDARALYGVPAALHAWIEIPLLTLAFAAIFRGDDGRRAPSAAP
jgi:hypothetical protein